MKFASATPLLLIIMMDIASKVSARAASDGKYSKQQYGNGNHGKYVHKNEGDYVEDVGRYRYVHYDDGHRGRYFHVHVPYDGGYGNYAGGHEPFRNPPYDATGLYADSSVDNPFKSSEYDIRKPSVYIEYGTPYPEFNYGASSNQAKQTPAAAELDPRISKFSGLGYLPVPKPASQYGPPEQSESAKNEKVVPFENVDIGAISLTTATAPTTREEDPKIKLISKAPETRTRITLAPIAQTERSPTTPSTTAIFSTKPPASVEQQLHQCQRELEAARSKLSHN